MHRLVKAELFKLFKNRTFKVLCTVALVLSILIVVLASPAVTNFMLDSLGDMPAAEKEAMLQQMGAIGSEEQVVIPGRMGVNLVAKDFMNPTTLEVYHSAFGAGVSEILIGILIAAFLAKEYTQGTIKNTLAYGKKRWEFYMAKFLALIVGIVCILFCLVTVPTIGSMLMNGWGQEFQFSQIISMFSTFVAAVIANSAVAAIIMLIAILIKSNGGTIGVTVGLFILLPTILSFLYGVYPWFDRLYEVSPYYNTQLSTSIYATNGHLIKSILISMVTIVISLFAGIQIFKAQDIK